MVKTAIFLFLLLGCASVAHGAWELQDSTTAPHPLYGLFFVDSLHGWAWGDSGTFMRTTNGRTWILLDPPATWEIRKMLFTDTETGYIVTQPQLIKTTDGGTTWNILYNVGANEELVNISNIGQDTIALAMYYNGVYSDSGKVLLSINGGSTFYTIFSRVEDWPTTSIVLLRPMKILVSLSSGDSYYSNDLGVHWYSSITPICPFYGIKGYNRVNDSCVVTSCQFANSSISYDRGETWVHSFGDVRSNNGISAFSMWDETIYYTENLRNGWAVVDSTSPIREIVYPDTQHAYGIGGNAIYFNNCSYTLHSISGFVTDTSGFPIPDQRVSAYNRIILANPDSTGYWEAFALSGPITISVHSLDWSFQPPETTINIFRDADNINFIGVRSPIPIYGMVITSTYEGIYGVSVTITGEPSAMTDSIGSFQAYVSYGRHIFTPNKPGYRFSPTSIDANVTTLRDDFYFIGTPIDTVEVDRTFDLSRGWNLISWSLRPAELRPLVTFPFALSAFTFSPVSRTYTRADSLAIAPEQGFWLLSRNDTTTSVIGQLVDSLRIDVPTPGWVLCGNTTEGATVESLRTVPPDRITAGSIYIFQPGSGYALLAAGRIPPGRGFWILVTEPCQIRVR